MTFEIANYHIHRQTLVGLLTQPCIKPVLLIRGEKDYGKTWLLKWFSAQNNGQFRLLKFDLADPQKLLSPSFILRKCSKELGEENFPKFTEAVPIYKQSRIALVIGNKAIGDRNVFTADAGGSLQDQLLVALDLTNIFVEELKKIETQTPPIVFAFDHVELAGSLIFGWLFECLIPALHSVPHSRVVLASSQLPELDDVSWEKSSTTITLTGITEPGDWHSLVELLNKRFPIADGDDPKVFLQGVILACKGIPGTLMPIIRNFPAKASHG